MGKGSNWQNSLIKNDYRTRGTAQSIISLEMDI